MSLACDIQAGAGAKLKARATTMGEREPHRAVGHLLAQDIAIPVEVNDHDGDGDVARVALRGDDAREPALGRARTPGDDA